MISPLASSTGQTGLRRDRHQGLSDGLLPALRHLHADSWGSQSRAVVGTAVVLPHIVDHGRRDDLKAVWVATLGQITVVPALFNLEDLRQRDFLWEGWETLYYSILVRRCWHEKHNKTLKRSAVGNESVYIHVLTLGYKIPKISDNKSGDVYY